MAANAGPACRPKARSSFAKRKAEAWLLTLAQRSRGRLLTLAQRSRGTDADANQNGYALVLPASLMQYQPTSMLRKAGWASSRGRHDADPSWAPLAG